MCDDFLSVYGNHHYFFAPSSASPFFPGLQNEKFELIRIPSYRMNGLTQLIQQYIILRVGMAEMLPESFPITGIYPVTRKC